MNILLLTSNYPADDVPKDLTSVVHYFTKEWVLMGHRVIVVHNQTTFPYWVYFPLRFLKQKLANKTGYSFITHKLPERDYIIDNVKVFRRNMIKPAPRCGFTKKSYDQQTLKIKQILELQNFTPDIIIGHWLTPQLKLIHNLQTIYHKRTALVIHEELPLIQRDYGSSGELYLKSVNTLGYRSKRIKEVFEREYPWVKAHKKFMCYSGIPTNFISTEDREIKYPFMTYTYIGTLIERKHPEALIEVLKDKKNTNFTINYIGDGPLANRIQTLANKNNMQSKVQFHGRISRDNTQRILFQTDCFIMISEKETFGLVYLEAMAAGCITIASKNEGIDGIIIDGHNGFLCEAGNANDLKSILTKIENMSVLELAQISQNAKKTALLYTNPNTANRYLNSII